MQSDEERNSNMSVKASNPPVLLPKPAGMPTPQLSPPGFQSFDQHSSSTSDATRSRYSPTGHPTITLSPAHTQSPIPVLRSSNSYAVLPSNGSSFMSSNGFKEDSTTSRSTTNTSPTPNVNGVSRPMNNGSSYYPQMQPYSYATLGSNAATVVPSSTWNQQPQKFTSAAQLVTRRRAVRACRHCRRRKIRCSGANQSKDGRCENCERAGLERCVFSSVSNEHQSTLPSQSGWQPSALPPDVQLCNAYTAPRQHQRPVQPPGYPPIIWPQEGYQPVADSQSYTPMHNLPSSYARTISTPSHNSKIGRKRAHEETYVSSRPPMPQLYHSYADSPFASNFWAAPTTHDIYSDRSSDNSWATDHSSSSWLQGAHRRDSKQPPQYQSSFSGVEMGSGTLKRMKSGFDRGVVSSVEGYAVDGGVYGLSSG